MTGESSERRAELLAALYQSGNFIVERVVSFIAEGLAAAEHVLVLCTMAHWNTIASRLDSGGIGYGRATADGRLLFVDAEELLAACPSRAA